MKDKFWMFAISFLIVLNLYVLMNQLKHEMDDRPKMVTLYEAPPIAPPAIPLSNRFGIQTGKVGFLSFENEVWPLFKYEAPYRRHRYTYYTVNDVIKVPVYYKNRNCLEELACDEIFHGDIVNIHGYDRDYVVYLY